MFWVGKQMKIGSLYVKVTVALIRKSVNVVGQIDCIVDFPCLITWLRHKGCTCDEPCFIFTIDHLNYIILLKATFLQVWRI